MACCQRHDLRAPAEKKWIAANNKRLGVQLHEGCEGGVDLLFGAGLQDRKLHPHCLCRFLQLADPKLARDGVRAMVLARETSSEIS